LDEHIYAEITVRPLAGSTKSWTGTVLALASNPEGSQQFAGG
jgi:hypothetical protein